MTLYEIVDILKKIALDQPNIRSASDGSVYDKMNTNPSVQYDVFHISQTNHQEDFETDYYGLQLFYISRLEDSLEDNRLQIQSIGKEILGNVIRTFCENFAIDYPTITYIPFTQKFNDLTAGVYCNVRLEVPKDLVCADDYIAEVVPGSGLKLQDIGITITENGLRVITADAEYDGIGEIRIVTDVPQTTADLQYKEVEYTENGEYVVRPDQDYDGLTEVAVSVDVPDNYDEGYEDGVDDQKAKLSGITITENGNYNREDGYSAITVNVPSIITNQEKNIVINDNTNPLTWFPELGAYALQTPLRVSADSGYTGIEPAVVDVYCDASEAIQYGYNEGVAAEKAKLIATSFTQNDTYEKASGGWSSVTVNVADRYDEGYEDGFNDGEDAQKAKMIATAITENGEYGRPDGYSAITVNVPQTGSSNEDLIANLQGDYYVIPNGTDHLRKLAFYNTCFSSITIPNTVRIINAYAFANNTCLTSMTFPSSVTAVGSYVLCGDTALEEITFEGTTPPTLGNTRNSLGSTAYTFPIYVPCQSINAYKTAFGSSYSPRIRCKSSELITAITLNVASAITDSATATTTYSPSTAYTDIYYTSSDTNIATINSATGVISAKANGTVTICTKDRLSGLQDCKSVSITKSPAPATSISINVPGTITDSATATTTVTPSSATTNLRYSSSDTSKATINATTGVITVISGGSVTFCVTDSVSTLQSCKTVTVLKNEGKFDIVYNVTSTSSPTNIKALPHSGSGYDVSGTTIISGKLNNGTLINVSGTGYTFPSSGQVNVAYTISGTTLRGWYCSSTCPSPVFENVLSIREVTLKDNVEYIGGETFAGCSNLKKVVISDSLKTLGPKEVPWKEDGEGHPVKGRGVFEDCTSLSSVTLGNGLAYSTTNPDGGHITPQCFKNCSSLPNINLPVGIHRIDEYAFANCTSLSSITINRDEKDTVVGLDTGALDGCTALQNIYVPSDLVNRYKNNSMWSSFADKITAIIP